MHRENQTPRYTIHADSAVPGMAGRQSPDPALLPRLHRFRPQEGQLLSRSEIIHTILKFGRYTETLRTELDNILPGLKHQEQGLRSIIEQHGGGHTASYDYLIGRLEHLRQSPILQALEELPGDPAIGNYMVRLAEHYPSAPDPSRGSARDRLRLMLRTILNDCDPDMAKDAQRNRSAFAEIVHAQAGLMEELQLLREQLYHLAGSTGPMPDAMLPLHQGVEQLLNTLDDKAAEFAGLLTGVMDRMEHQPPAAGRTTLR